MNQRFIIIYFKLRIVADNYSELSWQSYSVLANGKYTYQILYITSYKNEY